MSLSNYSDLTASVIRWAMRTDDVEFAAQVPDFIALTEQVLNYGTDQQRPLRVAEMEKVTTLTPDASGVLALPSDYLEARSLRPGTPGYDALTQAGIDSDAGAYPYGGVPSRISIVGTAVRTYPDANTAVPLVYYAKIPALSASNPTNWLLTKAPGVYLYGALLQSAPYSMDDARMQTWGAMFGQYLSGLINSDAGARYPNTVSRVRGCTP